MTSGLVVMIKGTLNLYSVTPVRMNVGVLTNLEMWSQDQGVYHKSLSVAIATLTLYKVKYQKDYKPHFIKYFFRFPIIVWVLSVNCVTLFVWNLVIFDHASIEFFNRKIYNTHNMYPFETSWSQRHANC